MAGPLDKTIVITGAGGGIGRATALVFSREGANVVVTDMDGEAARRTAETIQQSGGHAISVAADVSSREHVNAAVAQAIDRFGRVNFLFNSAGAAVARCKFLEIDDALLNKTLAINLHGTYYAMQAVLPHMLEQGGGVIVNVGSMSADIVNYPQEQANYNASKAGVHHLTRSLAAEWAARGVRVNAVAPTYIETDLTKDVALDGDISKHWIDGTPMARLGKPSEIASVILFLACNASSLMTGSIVSVDGGYTCW